MRTLRERVEECERRNPGVSRTDIARVAGVKQPSVSDWFNGKTARLKLTPAVKAAALWGCDPLWLGEGEGLPNWRDHAPPTVKEPLTLQAPTLAQALPVVLVALATVPEWQRQELLDTLAMCVRYGRPADAKRLAELLTPNPDGPNLTAQDRADAKRLQDAALAAENFKVGAMPHITRKP